MRLYFAYGRNQNFLPDPDTSEMYSLPLVKTTYSNLFSCLDLFSLYVTRMKYVSCVGSLLVHFGDNFVELYY